jgi:hypothetical protein
LPAGKGSKYVGKLLPAAVLEYVRNRVLVQSGQEGIQSLIEHPLEPAHGRNRTCIRLLLEAFNKAKIRLRTSDHVAEVNQMRLARKPYAAGTAGMDNHVAVIRERLNHSYQMIL